VAVVTVHSENLAAVQAEHDGKQLRFSVQSVSQS
jgi:hypothetical protein